MHVHTNVEYHCITACMGAGSVSCKQEETDAQQEPHQFLLGHLFMFDENLVL